jgi:hypothetical protein
MNLLNAGIFCPEVAEIRLPLPVLSKNHRSADSPVNAPGGNSACQTEGKVDRE